MLQDLMVAPLLPLLQLELEPLAPVDLLLHQLDSLMVQDGAPDGGELDSPLDPLVVLLPMELPWPLVLRELPSLLEPELN